jgi:O-antigen/teichoic acid export membrane protein
MSNITNFINLRKNPVVRSIGIYTFSNFFAKGASFLLLFVFTNPKYILPSENGLLSLFSNSLLFLMPFLSMGIIQSTSTDFFKLGKDDFRSFFTTGFVLPGAITIFSFIGFFIFRDQLQRLYGFPHMFVWLIPLITFFTFCSEQLLGLARNNNEPMIFLKANMSKTILEIGLSFILVVFFSWRWQGRIAGILVAYGVVALYAFYYFLKRGYLFGTIKKEYILSELVFAIPIIAMQASVFAMSASDKFFLSNFTADKNETVGIYSVGCIFASIVFLFSSALIQYIFPKLYVLLASPVIDYKSIKKHFLIYVSVMAAGSLGVIILTPLLYHLFINAKYHPALRYSYILCTGYFLWSVTYFFYSYLLYHKKKKKILALAFCGIVISLGCNYFFIKNWHEMGAAFAVLTCYFLVLILTLIVTKEYWKKFLFSDIHNTEVAT